MGVAVNLTLTVLIMADNNEVSSILPYLKYNKRLEREKDIFELRQLMDSGSLPLTDRDQLESILASILFSSDGPWEEKLRVIMVVCLIVEKNKVEKCLEGD